MFRGKKVAVIIPSYRVKNKILSVLEDIPEYVDQIFVVDDKCPEKTGEFVASKNIDRVSVLFHDENQGVGGAVISGFKRALELQCDYFVKVDGDGQMDPKAIEQFLERLDLGSDYVKANRFQDFVALRKMPKIRLFGNSVLSFWVKAASGYWNVMDPTNGYVAVNKKTLSRLQLDKISKDYFFEIDMLINLNIVGACVEDIPLSAKYEDEQSSLSITKTLRSFPQKIMKGLLKRVFLKYYIYDFNMLSLYLLFGLPLFFFGILWGGVHWIDSIVTKTPKPTGTVMIAVLCVVMGFQLLLQAINIDIFSGRKK